MKNNKQGFVVPLVIGIIALLAIGSGSYIYVNKKAVENLEKEVQKTVDVVATTTVKTEKKTTQATTTTAMPVVKPKITTVQTSPVVINADANDLDIVAVKVVLTDIGSAYTTGDISKITKHCTDETKIMFSQPGVVTVAREFTVKRVFKSKALIIADVVVINKNGSTEDNSFVFIKEGGEWKLDFGETMNWELSGKNEGGSAVSSDPNGYVDLVVTGVKVYPAHPIVNSKDVEIVISVKNAGTKIDDKGAPMDASFLEFKDSIPTSGGQLMSIQPGETVNWSYKPYSSNDFFKISDTAGKKTLQVNLNKYKDVSESNYQNNTFTQVIEIFEK